MITGFVDSTDQPVTENTDVCYWRCPNCGQVHFGDTPPDMCAFCRDFTTWQLISGTLPLPDADDLAPSNGEGVKDTSETPEDEISTHNRLHQRRLFD